MFSNQPAEQSLNVPTKALDAVRADKTDSRFIVGSCALQQNQLNVLRFHSELNELGVDGTLDHPTGPVGIVCTSPSDKSLVMTAAEHQSSATLWRMPFDVMDRTDALNYNPEGDESTDDLMSLKGYSLEEVSILEHNGPRLADILWHDSGMLFDEETSTAVEILTLDFGGGLQLWDVGDGSARAVRTETLPMKSQITRPRVAWVRG